MNKSKRIFIVGPSGTLKLPGDETEGTKRILMRLSVSPLHWVGSETSILH